MKLRKENPVNLKKNIYYFIPPCAPVARMKHNMTRTDHVHSEDIELSAEDHTNSQDPLWTTIHQILSVAFPFYFLIEKFQVNLYTGGKERVLQQTKLGYIVKQYTRIILQSVTSRDFET